MKRLGMIAALAVGLASGSAFAAEIQGYDAVKFKAAQEAGKTIVLAFHKDGCATCAAQAPKMQAVLEPLDSAKVAAFVVKFDPSAELAKQFGVVKQSTLVVLKGKALKAKELGVTDEAKIRDLVNKGM
jgi:thiol-disulfide isomerase/thioredoxin